MLRLPLVLSLLAALITRAPASEPALPGFERSPWFGEQVREERLACGVRLLFNAPPRFDPDRPTRVVFYAAPNGNSIEQTLGSAPGPGTDWRFDIQHIAAQTRRWREVNPRENLVLVCAEAEGRSWPAWRRKHPDSPVLIRTLVRDAVARLPGRTPRVTLAAHSGGGSFLFGFLSHPDPLPASVGRIAFLDANYSYSDAERHGDKLLAWLSGSSVRRLVVLAYDDRNIVLDGKPVVGPAGGTFRASHRMLDRFRKDGALAEATVGSRTTYTGRGGQITVLIDANPENKILHTTLVGDWNGYLHSMTLGTPEEAAWGRFGGARAYGGWVQPAASAGADFPPRPLDAPGGAALMERIAALPLAEREAALAAEVRRGNIPAFLRRFQTVRVTGPDVSGRQRVVVYSVMPDYLAVGGDTDFVRVPLTPMTAQQIADRFGCGLPTRKMVDDIYAAAEVKLEPRPLTQEREAVRTFVQHHRLIEEQRAGRPAGVLLAGIKKDLVVTNRLKEKPRKVAIYGWHQLDGKPIQPLTIVHRDTYVDYSHGVRLVSQAVLIDGKPARLADVLKDPELAPLLSDEGPIDPSVYPTATP